MKSVETITFFRKAIFMPKDMDTLHPSAKCRIGITFDWLYAGVGQDDEMFPGQTRWMPYLADGMLGPWNPNEDLVDVNVEETSKNAQQ